MQEAQALTMVSQFHQLFGAPILDTPQIPSSDRSTLRISLLQEELNELQQAINDNDIVEVADALADLQYVLAGAILEFWLWDRFAAIVEEVHRSNMSKACSSLSEAEATVTYYHQHKNTQAHIVPQWDQYLILRTEDNKVLKSINYSPAKLQQFVI